MHVYIYICISCPPSPAMHDFGRITESNVHILAETAPAPSDSPRGVEVPWESETDAAMPHLESQLPSHVTTFPYVRLCKLQKTQLNGKAGQITSFNDDTGRCGVLLHSRDRPLAIRPANLENYYFHTTDVCEVCNSVFNLCSFPACRCNVNLNLDETVNEELSHGSRTSQSSSEAVP